MSASVQAISYYLPSQVLTNEKLSEQHPEWPIEKIYSKTGIRQRHIADKDEYSLELALKAAENVFLEHENIKRHEIDFIIFCSQTPKFLVPSSACILQEMLKLPTSVGTLDINQGCSGYVYSLMLAESLINSKRAKKILLITADTYTKLIDVKDRVSRTIFGDGAAASIIAVSENPNSSMNLFEFGTDGSGAEKLIARHTGINAITQSEVFRPDLYMDGASIFNFTLKEVPNLVERLLLKANLASKDIDLFVFHQANHYMLEHLRQKIGITEEKFFVFLENIGNTVSSSIPIALHEALKQNKIQAGNKVMLVGFGVGLSWAATILEF